MKFIFVSLFLGLLSSCSDPTGFTESDKKAVNDIRRDYVNGWLANDSESVLGLFTENATIVPSGLSPISGKDQMENYWFPNDSSITTIYTYEVELLELEGVDSMAYSLEKGILNFTYEKDDFSITKTSTSHATTVYKKDKSGYWKIISRMWTSLNK